MSRIISRKDALAQGLKFYFSGKPCPRGHEAERYVSNMSCSECLREKSDAQRESAARHYARNKEKIREVSALYYHENRDAILVKAAAYRAENKEAIREIKARYRAAKKAANK